MLRPWLLRYVWRPFEEQARRTPLWPLRSTVEEPVPGVACVRIDNAVTRSLSRLAGGYDYAVCYVLHDTVLIDTGFPWAGRELRRVLAERGWSRTLRFVVNSHYHEDHVGNNDVVAEEVAEVCFLGSAETAAAVRLPIRLPWYRRFLFGPSPPSRLEVAPKRLEVAGTRLQFLDTPGHCPGHLCVFVPETGWLFSGDLFVAPDLDTQLPDVDGPAWIQSLDSVLALPVTALFDSHGTVVLGAEAVRTALRRKRDFLHGIGERVREHLDNAVSVEDLSRRVFDGSVEQSVGEWLSLGDGWLSLLTDSDFSRYHLVESFARPLLRERNRPFPGENSGSLRIP